MALVEAPGVDILKNRRDARLCDLLTSRLVRPGVQAGHAFGLLQVHIFKEEVGAVLLANKRGTNRRHLLRKGPSLESTNCASPSRQLPLPCQYSFTQLRPAKPTRRSAFSNSELSRAWLPTSRWQRGSGLSLHLRVQSCKDLAGPNTQAVRNKETKKQRNKRLSERLWMLSLRFAIQLCLHRLLHSNFGKPETRIRCAFRQS